MNEAHVPHVVYIITKLELGGAQKVCLTLFENFSKEKRSTLITGAGGYLSKYLSHSHDVYFLKNLTREVGLGGFFREALVFFEIITLLRKLKKKHGDLIIHTHSTKAGILGRWAAWFSGNRNIIHTVHGFGFNNYQSYSKWGIIYFLEWVTSFITSRFVCVSSRDSSDGAKLLPGFSKKYSLIRASVEWEKFFYAHPKNVYEEDAVCERKFIFGSISCFKPQKNIIDLIRAFHIVQRRFVPIHGYDSIELHIIGDGVMRPEIESLIASYNLSDAIRLHGWRDDVLPLMQQWNAYVMSSLWEGLPCSVIEARLLKLPVVLYRVGGIDDVIIHGKNGILSEPKDWHTLGLNMEGLIRDKKRYHYLQTYEDNLEDFKNSVMVEKHAMLYRELF